MSRQSDIEALSKLRDMISETKSMISLSNAELEKYEACEKELKETKFVFQPLPTNQGKEAKDNYAKAWKDRWGNPRKMQMTVQWILTILMVVFSVFVFVDMCTAKGWFFKDVDRMKMLAESPMSDGNWLFWVAQIIFSILAIVLTWSFFMFESYELFAGMRNILIGMLISGFVFGAGCAWVKQMSVLYTYLIFTVGSMVIVGLVYLVCKLISKVPILSPKQKAFVAEQKQKDKENAVENIEKEKKDKADWQAWWDVHKYEIDEQMDIHMKMAKSALDKAEELQAAVEASDVLGENEKHIATIDWLLYFIRGHRADSIKEALQQYDLMQHNQKMLEIEREKYNLEVERIKKENADRERALEMERYHQMQMQAQAARAADMQARIAMDAAAARDSAERIRKEVTWHNYMNN